MAHLCYFLLVCNIIMYYYNIDSGVNCCMCSNLVCMIWYYQGENRLRTIPRQTQSRELKANMSRLSQVEFCNIRIPPTPKKDRGKLVLIRSLSSLSTNIDTTIPAF